MVASCFVVASSAAHYLLTAYSKNFETMSVEPCRVITLASLFVIISTDVDVVQCTVRVLSVQMIVECWLNI